MSTMQSFLVLVFIYEGDMIRATNSFKEEDMRDRLGYLGIEWPADRKEVHLVYSVVLPLTEEQVKLLNLWKVVGTISNWYVKDEISSEIESQTGG